MHNATNIPEYQSLDQADHLQRRTAKEIMVNLRLCLIAVFASIALFLVLRYGYFGYIINETLATWSGWPPNLHHHRQSMQPINGPQYNVLTEGILPGSDVEKHMAYRASNLSLLFTKQFLIVTAIGSIVGRYLIKVISWRGKNRSAH